MVVGVMAAAAGVFDRSGIAAKGSRVLAALVLLGFSSVPPGTVLLATVTAQPQGPGESSPFKEQATPPQGVLEEILALFPTFGLLGCLGANADSPPRVVAEEPNEIPTEVSIEFCRFAPNQDIAVQVRRPDGTVWRERVRTDDQGTGHWNWTSVPGDPLGTYTVTATQGTRQAVGTFTVRAAAQPRVLVLPNAAPPGGTFRIALAGFQPRQNVLLRLYRLNRESVRYRYATTLGSVQMDERGQAIYTLRSQTDDPLTEYLVVTDPPPSRLQFADSLFSITETGPRTSPQSIEAIAAAVVEEANRVWAAVLTRDGVPLSDLEHVFAGRWLAEVHARVEAMRAAGQYHMARLTAPVEVRRARPVGDRQIEVFVVEQWDDRLFNRDGSLAEVFSGRVEQRYLLERMNRRWFIVDWSLVRLE